MSCKTQGFSIHPSVSVGKFVRLQTVSSKLRGPQRAQLVLEGFSTLSGVGWVSEDKMDEWTSIQRFSPIFYRSLSTKLLLSIELHIRSQKSVEFEQKANATN